MSIGRSESLILVKSCLILIILSLVFFLIFLFKKDSFGCLVVTSQKKISITAPANENQIKFAIEVFNRCNEAQAIKALNVTAVDSTDGSVVTTSPLAELKSQVPANSKKSFEYSFKMSREEFIEAYKYDHKIEIVQ